MNFKGHFVGGIIAGVASVSIAVISGYAISASDYSLDRTISENMLVLSKIWSVAFFMALFPDLDTSSIPQRWSYRIILLMLLYFLIEKKMDYFVVTAIISVLPLIDKHRGWTHWKITPWIISIAFAIILEYYRSNSNWFSSYRWKNVVNTLEYYWIYIIASAIGHYTHLILDSHRLRRFAKSYKL